MKLILTANTLEHPGFARFVTTAVQDNEPCAVVVCGDLLNVFPEPGEDLRGSIFYSIYGDILLQELPELVAEGFHNVHKTPLLQPLREMFSQGGRTFALAKSIARQRYANVFGSLRRAMGNNPLYFIPGNMDYPRLCEGFAALAPNLHTIDGRLINIDGLWLAGLGGIPESAHPFHDIVHISPNELSDYEYERRLRRLLNAHVLVTHIDPRECPVLANSIRKSGIKLVICRAPFQFDKDDDYRGTTSLDAWEGTHILTVRPFDYPHNRAGVIDLNPSFLAAPQIHWYDWHDYVPMLPSWTPSQNTDISVAFQ